MPRPVKVIALLLAALWLPATLHCRLESMGFEALFSCADAQTESPSANQDDCANDSCETFESGEFTAARSELDIDLVSVSLSADFPCLYLTGPLVPAEAIVPISQTMTLPLQRTWQFARRAALPARAPDVPTA